MSVTEQAELASPTKVKHVPKSTKFVVSVIYGSEIQAHLSGVTNILLIIPIYGRSFPGSCDRSGVTNIHLIISIYGNSLPGSHDSLEHARTFQTWKVMEHHGISWKVIE